MLRRNHRTVFIVITALILLACVPTLGPAATPLPTYDPNSIGTSIAMTAGAAASQTAIFIPPTLTPTVTSLPTRTPTVTPTETATFVFMLTSPAGGTPGTPGTPGAEVTTTGEAKQYACELISQSPEDNSKLAPRLDFEVRWQVKNTGTETWSSNDIDYRYASGDKLHVDAGIYDLYKDVAPQEMADFIVKMRTPSDAGTYSTVWQVRVGKSAFCKLTLTISVK